MTEARIQDALAHYLSHKTRSDLALVPNCGALGHEADMLRVTKDRDVIEYEIKVSKADYRRDAKKDRTLWITHLNAPHIQATVHRSLTRGYLRLPHRLYYVTPAGLLEDEEIPAWAGVIEATESETGWLSLRVRKRGRRIHDLVAPARTLEYAYRGQAIRYWEARRELRDAQNRMNA